jgi:hypothetical protein
MDLITLEPTTSPAEPAAAPAPSFEWVGAASITGRTRVYGGTSKPVVANGAARVSMTMPDFTRVRSGERWHFQLPAELDRTEIWLGLGALVSVMAVVLGLLLLHPFGAGH